MTTAGTFNLELCDPVFALWTPINGGSELPPRPPVYATQGGVPSGEAKTPQKPPPPPPSQKPKPPAPPCSKPPPPPPPRGSTSAGSAAGSAAPGTEASKSVSSGGSGPKIPSMTELGQKGGHVSLSTTRDFNSLPTVVTQSKSGSNGSGKSGGSSKSSGKSGFFGFLRRKEKEEEFVISTPSNFRQFDVRVEDSKLVSTMTDANGQEIASPEPDLHGIDEVTQSGVMRGFIVRKKTEWVKPRVPQISEFRTDIEELVRMMNEMDTKSVTDKDFIDYWSSRPLGFEQWRDAEVDVPKQVMEDVREKGYHFEFGSQCATNDVIGCNGTVLLNMEEDYPYYAKMFANEPHDNYLFPEVPAIVSVRKFPTFAKVLLRHKKKVERLLIPPDGTTKTLCALPLLKDKKMIKVKNQDLAIRELVDYEKLELHVASKFGLVYCKPYEQDEDSLFSAQEGSPAYEEFLDFIGQRISLLGWDKYRGGLDVKGNVTGKESVYTTVLRHEIMFHVCTMLPFVKEDEQKVERKRHIGNDVVVLVFKDQGDPDDLFNTAIFRSHFIHCVFVVTPVLGPDGKTTHYRLFISNKPGVPPYPPSFPDDRTGADSNLFPKTTEFRDWLLLKMVNAGRAGLGSAEFNSLITARRQKLSFICERIQEQG